MSEALNFLDREQDPSAFATVNLLNLIAQDGPRGMEEILERRNGGIYPTRTNEELELLEGGGLVVRDDQHRYSATRLGRMELLLQGVKSPVEVQQVIGSAREHLEQAPPNLPPEKYGNEEFRFTWDSVAELTHKIVKDNSYATPRVLALGAPTIAYFGALCKDVMDSYLLDVNSDIVDDIARSDGGVKAALYDARDPIPPTFKGKFDAVVFDPPWHNEFYSLFADRGYDFLRPYGQLYMSTPAPATRPEAARELNGIYTDLIRGGYNLIEVTPEFFGYQIPTFERNVFREQGIDVRSRGKYGQLVVAQAVPGRSDTCSTRESINLTNQERCHTVRVADLDIGDLYLTEKPDAINDDTDPANVDAPMTVTRFGEGVYTTTSRSQRRAEGVNFITREHVAFVIDNPNMVLKVSALYKGTCDQAFIAAISDTLGLSSEAATVTANEFQKIINTASGDKE